MKKYVLIPDSFKGTMSSGEICRIMKAQILRFCPGAEVVNIPVADGGEGSVDAFLQAAGGKKRRIPVKGPYMEDIDADYGILPDGTAVIETASCAGLPLVEGRQNPEKTTTYGIGQMMVDAAACGCRRIVVGLGGSCTNDGGAGAAAAAGVRFWGEDGKDFLPTGGTLSGIRKIDCTGLDPRLHGVEILAMCDIDNPLFGTEGAASVFAPQKGADEEMVRRLDAGLRNFAKVIGESLGIDVAEVPGAGAAGGMGAGMLAFFGAKLQKGIDVMLDVVGFDDLVKDADMVFTGEGKIDQQSIRGKVVVGVARRMKGLNIPLIAVVGDIGDRIEAAYSEGVSAVFSINRVAVPYQEARLRSRDDLALTMENLMRFFASIKMK